MVHRLFDHDCYVCYFVFYCVHIVTLYAWINMDVWGLKDWSHLPST